MTTIDTEPRHDAPEWQSWTRRTWWLVWGALALAVLLVAALIVGTKVNSLDDEYGPVGYGSGGGLGSAATINRVGDQRLLATTGNRTTYVLGSLRNSGTHSVRITGIEFDDVTVGAQWVPLRSYTADSATRWRDFPATISGEVMVRYEIRRPPHCQDKAMTPGEGEFYSDNHVVHWESLLGDHETTVGTRFGTTTALQIC